MGKLYETGISPDETYLFARAFQHPFTFELAQTLAVELVLLGEKLNVLGCLIDISETTSASKVIDKYKFAYEKAKIIGLPFHWRYAFLKAHGDNSPIFIETVMSNAGYIIRIFDNESEAVEWLKGEQSANNPD